MVAFGGIQATSAVCLGTPTTPVLATTLNSAEVFDPGTQTWSATANTMGVKRATTATLIKAGSLAGEVILPGGVDVEAGTSPSTCAATTGIKQRRRVRSTCTIRPPERAAPSLRPARSMRRVKDRARAYWEPGTDATDVIVIGGACTTPTPSLQSVVIGSRGRDYHLR